MHINVYILRGLGLHTETVSAHERFKLRRIPAKSNLRSEFLTSSCSGGAFQVRIPLWTPKTLGSAYLGIF